MNIPRVLNKRNRILLKELTKDWNPKQNNLYKLVKILTKTK